MKKGMKFLPQELSVLLQRLGVPSFENRPKYTMCEDIATRNFSGGGLTSSDLQPFSQFQKDNLLFVQMAIKVKFLLLSVDRVGSQRKSHVDDLFCTISDHSSSGQNIAFFIVFHRSSRMRLSSA
ncbi:hypothetical protein NPIL_572371 [Nephila pilipes]|uniref:Uncharacterized protein n=1 Tax=Nephila pilipes TaxID=299642 RepID=A0A8X6TX00_NEPPI|nr:hypothetical protein NPIL_572371 [Nephila pilipes]